MRKLLWLLLVPALLGAGLVYAVYQRAVSLVEERVAHGPWEVPSHVYAGAWTAAVGKAVPPGPLLEVLGGMGYTRAKVPTRPGEFLPLKDGVRVVARQAWPGAAVQGAVDVTVKDFTVVALKSVRGAPLRDAVFPAAPLAELRGVDQQSRKPVTLAQVPKALQQAVVAVEDKRFFEHHGVDPKSVLRAIFTNAVAGEHAQGGSTLSQQLAKNMFLTREKTYTRKLKELFFASALEHRFAKNQILELYLNAVYLGQHGAVAIMGVGQAALAFFSKDVSQLSLEECALLAGIIQAPNGFAPDRHGDRAKSRRDVVLHLMLEQGMVTQEAHDRAVAKPIVLKPSAPTAKGAPWAVDDLTEAINDVVPGVDLAKDGLHVETTLNARIQNAAQAALAHGLERLEKAGKGAGLEGAVMVLDPATGAVLAMVGGRDYAQSQFNRATLGKRQPGSAFKPLIMLAAMHLGVPKPSPSLLIQDEPLTLHVTGKPWSPRNSDRRFHGAVTLRETLEQSLNVPTVKTALATGLPAVATFFGALGLKGRLEPVPALALGVFEMSPWELAGAYTCVAHGGLYHAPYLIKQVWDAQGHLLMEGAPNSARVTTEAEAYMVKDMLRGVMEQGTAKSSHALGYVYPASGKTGTTSEGKDAWFVGFDAQLLTVVWVGADTPTASGLSGAQAALPIWVELMMAVRRDSAPPLDRVPDGVVAQPVCEETRQKALTSCPLQHRELYWPGTQPEVYCTSHAGPADRFEALLRNLPRRLQSLFGAVLD